jgi:DNA-binding response OmpR family regulator
MVLASMGIDGDAGSAGADLSRLVRASAGPAPWQYDFEGYERTIDVHVKNLRRKLGDAPPSQLILTVAGVGYKLGVELDA